jgi:iron(III) transport system ATP-binding protein
VDIRIEGLTRCFGDVTAVDDVSLRIGSGELLVLLGPSGCGKTTTMRSIVGLETPTKGLIEVGGQVVFDADQGINVPANKRHMGMVFQSYAIWPHKTVFENVSFPLERQGDSKLRIRERVGRALDMVGLRQVSDRGASLLSGGQMQRVALARSIVAEPKVLLLDEPLSNLDAKLRAHLRFEIRDIQQRLGITTIYVTHDQSEALALADRIAVMRDGKIVQLDRPNVLYRQPANVFVADFLGVSNILPGRVVATTDTGLTEVLVEPAGLKIVSRSTAPVGQAVHVCMRPEHLAVGPPQSDAAATTALPNALNTITLEVQVASFLGSHVRYLLTDGSGFRLEAMSTDTEHIYAARERVAVTIPAAQAQLLSS